MRSIVYRGEVYKSITDFAERHKIKYDKINEMIRNLKKKGINFDELTDPDLDQIVARLQDLSLPKARNFTYRGTRYATIPDFAEDIGISAIRFRKIMHRHNISVFRFPYMSDDEIDVLIKESIEEQDKPGNKKFDLYNTMKRHLLRTGFTEENIAGSDYMKNVVDEQKRRLTIYFLLMEQRYGYDFDAEYKRLLKTKSLSEAWKNPKIFLKAMGRLNPENVKPGMTVQRIAMDEPYSKNNCYFGSRGYNDGTRIYFSERRRDIEQSFREAETLLNTDLMDSWYRNIKRGVFDKSFIRIAEYKERIAYLYSNGYIEPNMYMTKIRKDRPMTAENIMFSYKRRAKYVHGMSSTLLQSRHQYYKGVSGDDIGVADFSEYSVYEKEYLPNKHMKIERNGEMITLEDITYCDLNDGFHQEEMKAIMEAWKKVALMANRFESRNDFFAWTLLSGYRKGMTFRCFSDTLASPDNCAWEFFTPMTPLNRILLETDVSERELARRLKVPYAITCAWARGTAHISDENRKKIAKALNVEEEALVA